MKARGSTALLPIVALYITGCAMGQRVNYSPVASDLPVVPKSMEQLRVGVLDSRPEVVSGKHNEHYVGATRSGFGIPFPTSTTSGKPLAEDFATVIADSFRRQGVKVTILPLSPFKPREESLRALHGTDEARRLLVEIKEWASDTYMHTSLHYDVVATVFGNQGQPLGGKEIQGEDELGRKSRPERRDLPSAYRDILQTLLTSAEVKAAFASDPNLVPTSKVGCTVEQILKMKESGLTEEQIKAACGSGR
jgi:hypothetical protein